MNTAYLLLGTNEGDRLEWLRFAINKLEEYCGNISAMSKIYSTAAWGIEDQPDFLNMAVKLETSLAPLELLNQTSKIETEAGRQRKIKWGQRTLDIDILFLNDIVFNEPSLHIPHPEIANRRFALVPLQEIAPLFIHPKTKDSVTEMLKNCADELEVKVVDNEPL